MLPEPLDIQVALNTPRVTNRNLAALLGDNQGDDIRFLREPESGPVTEADGAVEIVPLGQWEDASRGDDPVAAHDHPAVVKDRLGVKNRKEQFLRKFRIQLDAALRNGAEADVPLNRDQGAKPLAREVENRIGDFLDRFPPLEGRCEEPVAAEFVQGTAKFRLEKNDQGNGEEDREAPQDPAEYRQIKDLGDEGERQKDQSQPDQDPGAVGAAQVEINIIEDRAENQDLQTGGPIRVEQSEGGMEKFAHAARMASVMRSASACGRGS